MFNPEIFLQYCKPKEWNPCTIESNAEARTSVQILGVSWQEVCYASGIDPIIIDVVGDNTYGSIVNPANLPTGLNFDFVEDADNMGGVITITGSPTGAIAGNDPVTYTFTITTDGANTSPCAGATETVRITVVPRSTLVYAGADPSTPNQIVCSGTPLTNIEFRIGGGARDVNLSGDLFNPAISTVPAALTPLWIWIR